MKKLIPIMLATAVMGLASAVQAITVNLGTGLDNNGAPLIHGAPEVNYAVGGNSISATVFTTGYPIPPWVTGDASGQWIRPNNEAVGISTYSMTIAGTGSITGRFTSDNPGALYVNNTLITSNDGWANGTDQNTYNRWFNFSAQLDQSVNVIEWQVKNLGGPAGLIVQGTATVPDGGLTTVLFGMGIFGLGCVRRMVK